MIKWRLAAGNDAIRTACGSKRDGVVESRGEAGCLTYGPYVDLPRGTLTARYRLARPARGTVRIDLSADAGTRVLASRSLDLSADDHLELSCVLDEAAQGAEVRVFIEQDADVALSGLELDLDIPAPEKPARDRPVGEESRKTFAAKVEDGFVDRYLSGKSILEIGYRGYRDEVVLPIVPQAIGVDIGYPGYDGLTLPFADGSVDAIYSSHCLEHIDDYRGAFTDWYRLLKTGGFLVLVVPHQYLFEKQRYLPSRSNHDHKRYYTPVSLLSELRETWPEGSYRIRWLMENDQGFDYSRLPHEPSPGCYEIEMVVEKIAIPGWNLDDGSVRSYGAAEFHGQGVQPDRWSLDLDFSSAERCKIWGPYARLEPGRYEAVFHFVADFAQEALSGDITLDIAARRESIASLTLSGEDGARRIRAGTIALPFDLAGEPAHAEFRTFADGRPVDGSIVFKGVELRFRRG